MIERDGPPAGHNVPRLPSPAVERRSESAQRHPATDQLMSSRSLPSRQSSRASLNGMFSEESRALLLAKMTRKRADEDVVAMQNRINRLKMEEYRAQKNIEDTHAKADDIVRLKAQNELKARAKEKAKKMQEDALQRERQQKTLERATRDANIRVRRNERAGPGRSGPACVCVCPGPAHLAARGVGRRRPGAGVSVLVAPCRDASAGGWRLPVHRTGGSSLCTSRKGHALCPDARISA